MYGENDPSLRFNSLVTLKPNFWNRMALQAQTKIISDLISVTLEALGAELGESNKPTIAQQILSAPISADDKVIRYGQDGVISIPAAGYTQSSGNPREVLAMKSFEGGMLIPTDGLRKGLQDKVVPHMERCAGCLHLRGPYA